MNPPNWTTLIQGIKLSALREKGKVWEQVLPFVVGPGSLRITAEGEWNYSNSLALKCGADGDLLSPLSSKRCVHENSAVGCLIGRIGGSSASRTSDGIFTVGSFCVVKITADQQGPLFLTINDMWTSFADNSGELTIKVEFTPLITP